MRISVIGGDERQVFLTELLRKDGHDVYDFALGNGGEMGAAVSCDLAVLPLPAFRDGYLNAPLSNEKYSKRYIMSNLKEARCVMGGMIDEPGVLDYYKREELTVENAYITAVCTIPLIQDRLKRPLAGLNALVVGHGRIGKFLAEELKNAGCRVTVSARKKLDEAAILREGLSFVNTYKIDSVIENQDIVINTVPHGVINNDVIVKSKASCLFVELASAPFGMDMDFVRKSGRGLVFAPGLPGKAMPLGAAMAIKDTIYNILEEKDERH